MVAAARNFPFDRQGSFVEVQQVIVPHYCNLTRTLHVSGDSHKSRTLQARSALTPVSLYGFWAYNAWTSPSNVRIMTTMRKMTTKTTIEKMVAIG